MKIIELDGSNWTTVLDIYDALFIALGAPEIHGSSPDALVDSMIWGGMNELQPPYCIRILGTATIPKIVKEEIEIIEHCIDRARMEYRQRRGRDSEVTLVSNLQ